MPAPARSRSFLRQLEDLRDRGKRFPVVYVDPPWRYVTWSKRDGHVRSSRSRAVHYRTATWDYLTALPVPEVCERHAVLLMWIPWPQLLRGIDLGRAWGFEYSTCGFDWMKITQTGEPAIGQGFWTRSNTEACLLFTRGKPKRIDSTPARSVRMAILEPRRAHSQKPDCVHERIQQMLRGPYLELFGRREVPGWTVLGDQVTKFNGGDRV
jgi:N6-adenosine-specific RNA methylase IME4